MSTKTIVILILAIVIEIILVHFLVSIRKVDGDAQTQVESLQEDIEKYVLLQSYVNLEFDENTIRRNSQIELENWIKSL